MRNHFPSVCQAKEIRAVDQEENDWLNAVEGRTKEKAYARMQVNGCSVKFHLDSAVSMNTIEKKVRYKRSISGTSASITHVEWHNGGAAGQGQPHNLSSSYESQIRAADRAVFHGCRKRSGTAAGIHSAPDPTAHYRAQREFHFINRIGHCP
jgi:hypothetical protein